MPGVVPISLLILSIQFLVDGILNRVRVKQLTNVETMPIVFVFMFLQAPFPKFKKTL